VLEQQLEERIALMGMQLGDGLPDAGTLMAAVENSKRCEDQQRTGETSHHQPPTTSPTNSWNDQYGPCGPQYAPTSNSDRYAPSIAPATTNAADARAPQRSHPTAAPARRISSRSAATWSS